MAAIRYRQVCVLALRLAQGLILSWSSTASSQKFRASGPAPGVSALSNGPAAAAEQERREQHRAERKASENLSDKDRSFAQGSFLLSIERIAGIYAVGDAANSGDSLEVEMALAGSEEPSFQAVPLLGFDYMPLDYLSVGLAGNLYLGKYSGIAYSLNPRVGGYLGNEAVGFWPKLGIASYTYNSDEPLGLWQTSVTLDAPLLVRLHDVVAISLSVNFSRAWHLGTSLGLVVDL